MIASNRLFTTDILIYLPINDINMLKKVFTLFICMVLFACSESDNNPQTNPDPEIPLEFYYLSLENTNYDISNLFFIKNNDYAHPLLTCYTHVVNVGDVIKVVGETNIISSDVVVNAIIKKNSETINSIELTRSTLFLNHPLTVNGLCNSPNSSYAASNVRLWKNNTGSTSFTIQ